jgi:hypothetical protein
MVVVPSLEEGHSVNTGSAELEEYVEYQNASSAPSSSINVRL